MMNESKIMLLRGQIELLRYEVEADDEWVDPRHLHEIADAAEDLTFAIRDRIGTSTDAYVNASQGGP